MGLRDLSIVEMESKMREMSAATYDGVFVWKITDFAKKRQDAVAGRAPAMFSPGTDWRLQVNLTSIVVRLQAEIHSCLFCSVLYKQVWLQDVFAHLPERGRNRARHSLVSVLRGDEGTQ